MVTEDVAHTVPLALALPLSVDVELAVADPLPVMLGLPEPLPHAELLAEPVLLPVPVADAELVLVDDTEVETLFEPVPVAASDCDLVGEFEVYSEAVVDTEAQPLLDTEPEADTEPDPVAELLELPVLEEVPDVVTEDVAHTVPLALAQPLSEGLPDASFVAEIEEDSLKLAEKLAIVIVADAEAKPELLGDAEVDKHCEADGVPLATPLAHEETLWLIDTVAVGDAEADMLMLAEKLSIEAVVVAEA